jgi:hypothetical protein
MVYVKITLNSNTFRYEALINSFNDLYIRKADYLKWKSYQETKSVNYYIRIFSKKEKYRCETCCYLSNIKNVIFKLRRLK